MEGRIKDRELKGGRAPPRTLVQQPQADRIVQGRKRRQPANLGTYGRRYRQWGLKRPAAMHDSVNDATRLARRRGTKDWLQNGRGRMARRPVHRQSHCGLHGASVVGVPAGLQGRTAWVQNRNHGRQSLG